MVEYKCVGAVAIRNDSWMLRLRLRGEPLRVRLGGTFSLKGVGNG